MVHQVRNLLRLVTIFIVAHAANQFQHAAVRPGSALNAR